jgi:hypothetical protein
MESSGKRVEASDSQAMRRHPATLLMTATDWVYRVGAF